MRSSSPPSPEVSKRDKKQQKAKKPFRGAKAKTQDPSDQPGPGRPAARPAEMSDGEVQRKVTNLRKLRPDAFRGSRPVRFDDGTNDVAQPHDAFLAPADKAVASFRLAKLLEMRVVGEIHFYAIGGESGAFSTGIRGRPLAEQPDLDLTAEYVQKGLFNLQVLDALTGQRGRNVNNIFVDPESETVTGGDEHQSFDAGVQPREMALDATTDGFRGIPKQIDESTARDIENLSEKDLVVALTPLGTDPIKLHKTEVTAAVERLRMVKKAVRKLHDDSALVERWDGKTYLAAMGEPDFPPRGDAAATPRSYIKLSGGAAHQIAERVARMHLEPAPEPALRGPAGRRGPPGPPPPPVPAAVQQPELVPPAAAAVGAGPPRKAVPVLPLRDGPATAAVGAAPGSASSPRVVRPRGPAPTSPRVGPPPGLAPRPRVGPPTGRAPSRPGGRQRRRCRSRCRWGRPGSRDQPPGWGHPRARRRTRRRTPPPPRTPRPSRRGAGTWTPPRGRTETDRHSGVCGGS